jgi:hypothetical protein
MNRFKKNANDMGVSTSANTVNRFKENKTDILGANKENKKSNEKPSPKLTPKHGFKR